MVTDDEVRWLIDREHYVVGGTYTDRVVRHADGWRIAHRTLSAVWTDGNSLVVDGGNAWAEARAKRG